MSLYAIARLDRTGKKNTFGACVCSAVTKDPTLKRIQDKTEIAVGWGGYVNEDAAVKYSFQITLQGRQSAFLLFISIIL